VDHRLRHTLEAALRDRRAVLLGRVAREESDLTTIAAERSAELIERGQSAGIGRLLSRLDDQARREVLDVDAALDRLLAGRYRRCTACNDTIPAARLRALPATALCLACAVDAERRHAHPTPARPVAKPPDLASLSNREIEDLVRRAVREDRRIDDDDLQIHFRRNVLRLAGTVPGEAHHAALRGLIDDVFGIREVVDRVEIRPDRR
jgi:RNA polymerase-binding transcription factor DksA